MLSILLKNVTNSVSHRYQSRFLRLQKSMQALLLLLYFNDRKKFRIKKEKRIAA